MHNDEADERSTRENMRVLSVFHHTRALLILMCAHRSLFAISTTSRRDVCRYCTCLRAL